MSDYKSYLLRQLGLKEAFPNEPEQVEQGAQEPESDKMPKFQSLVSPTAKNPNILAIDVRGTPSGKMPTRSSPSSLPASATADANVPDSGVDTKSKAALGGWEPVISPRPNSTLVDATPKNDTINSNSPKADAIPATGGEEHPMQVQNTGADKDVPQQALTGTSDDNKAPMGEKPEPEKFETDNDMRLAAALPQSVDVDVPREEGEQEEDKEQDEKEEEDLSKPHMVKETFGTKLDEVFARHKDLLKEKLGIGDGQPDPQKFEMDKEKAGMVKVNEADSASKEFDAKEKRVHKTFAKMEKDKNYRPFPFDKDHPELATKPDRPNLKTKQNETYSPAFEKMRGLAGISETRVLASNGLWEEKTQECKPCGCNKPNTEHPQKTKKFTTEQLKKIAEQLSRKTNLTEQEKLVSEQIAKTLQARASK